MSLSDTMQIEISLAKSAVPATGTLEERVRSTMRSIRGHQAGLMGWHNSEEELFRISIGAVILAVDREEDRDLLVRSMQPLKALSAAIDGVPVNIAAVDWGEDLLPLLRFWHDSKV